MDIETICANVCDFEEVLRQWEALSRIRPELTGFLSFNDIPVSEPSILIDKVICVLQVRTLMRAHHREVSEASRFHLGRERSPLLNPF